MKIVSEGQNPYIKQATCKTCKTVIAVDIRTECKRIAENKQCTDSYDPDQRTVDLRWNCVISTYYLACPTCSEVIEVHRSYDHSDRRKRYGY